MVTETLCVQREPLVEGRLVKVEAPLELNPWPDDSTETKSYGVTAISFPPWENASGLWGRGKGGTC